MLLIITACISVGQGVPNVSIRDTTERLQDYLKTIYWAIDETPFTDILFCDNSNYDLDTVNEVCLLHEYSVSKGKKLEYYHFQGDSKEVERRGKGYGEGEIISWLYDNCLTMRKYAYYYKITGRLTIHNVRQVYLSEKPENTFIFDVGSECVDTRFYKLSMETYKLFFKNAYWNVDDMHNLFLEHVYYRTLVINHLSFRRFNRSLEFRGKSGTAGVEYCAVYKENLLLCMIYNSFLYRTYFGRSMLKYIRRIIVD